MLSAVKLQYPLLFLFFPFITIAQQKDITVRIVQDDAIYIAENNQNDIKLQKKSFKIQVLLQNIKGIYLFASLKDSLYTLPDNAPVPGFAMLPEMTMAEENYNKEKELLINDEGWCYWFYDTATPWHRFNKKIITLDSGRIVGTKTIKQLLFLPTRLSVKLKDNNFPLYLFFTVAKETDANGRPAQELLRRKVKIEWIEED